MNNNFFAFARYLRDFGIDAHLYLNPDGPEHFTPANDTFEDISGFNWIHTFPYGDKTSDWLLANNKKIREILKNYDLIISCGLHIAYLERASIKSDIIFPYGADLIETPFKKLKLSLNFKLIKSLIDIQQAYYQTKGYKNARCVSIDATSSYYKIPLKKLNISWLNITPPMLYNKESLNIEEKKFLANNTIYKLKKSDFVVFNHSRQIWASNTEGLDDFNKYLGIKRNDKVIKGFAKFIKNTKFKYPLLVLFEYGDDIEESKKLIKSLNISDNVLWMPKSPRKLILFLLTKYATFGTGTFRENLWAGFNGVAYEVLASGTPLITNMENTEYFNSSPAIQAISTEEIYNIFIDYEFNPDKYINIGKESKSWFDKNLGEGLANKYKKLIYLLANNKNITNKHYNSINKLFE